MMNTTSRTRMKDIAAAAGVHRATVSRALRNDPRISAKVREFIQKKARELGYAPDPYLRALSDYRTKQFRRDFHGSLAWLTNFPTRDGWRVHEKIGYFEGAVQRAGELGYKIEIFWLREPGVSPARLRQILITRNIRGVLLPPQLENNTEVDLRLDGLAAISFGRTLSKPLLNVVHHNHYLSMQLLLKQLHAHGYRRPGLALTQTVHSNLSGAWTAAYLLDQYEKKTAYPEPLISSNCERKTFMDWFKRESPDVVICNLGDALDWLKQNGVKVPSQCGFAIPARHTGHPKCAGIDENNTEVGAAAIDLLVNFIEHGHTGLPAYPKTLLIEGRWIAGRTVKKQPAHQCN